MHCGLGVLLVTVLSFAAAQPAASAPNAVTASPPVIYSGLAAGNGATASAFTPGGSHATRASVRATETESARAQTTTTGPIAVMRSTDAVPVTESFSAGVSAAAATSGEASSGTQPLADIIDPQRPYALYTTQPGDTISSIAAAYDVSVETIIDNNSEVRDDSLILVGQKLLIPRTDGILYTVEHGETLSDIIDRYNNVTVDDVLAFRPNSLSDGSNLETGRQIILPNAVPKPPPPPPPPPEPEPAPAPAPAPSGSSGSPSAEPPPPSGGRFSLPVSAWNAISDPFGTPRGAGRIHTGTDFDLYGHWGSPIFSSCDGTVTRTEYLTYSYGYHVIVDCGDGWSTLYAHMSDIHVSPGQAVSAGTVLGISGSTGYSTGEHLHFEIRINGSPVNPAQYLPF